MLIGQQFKTVRETSNPFMQLRIQWFTADIISKAPTAITLESGSTKIVTAVEGLRYVFKIYGRDLQNRYYAKTIYTELEASAQNFNIKDNQQHIPLVVQPGRVFQVKAIKVDEQEKYYILNVAGIFMLISGGFLYKHVNGVYSVYEFNTLFPLTVTPTTTIQYKGSNNKTVRKSIVNFKFNNSSDIEWSLEGTDIVPSLPIQISSTAPDYTPVRSINGIQMTDGVVSVEFLLANQQNVSQIPEADNAPLENVIKIPTYTSSNVASAPAEAYCNMLTSIEGVKDNTEVFNKYGFTLDNDFDSIWSINHTSLQSASKQYYILAKNHNKNFVTIPDAFTADDYGVASLGIRVLPMLPAMSANTVGFTPEYRLFNPNFTSTKVYSKVQDETPIYFKLKKKDSDRWICHDGLSDNGKSLAVVNTSEEKYNIWVDAEHYDVEDDEYGVLVLEAEIGEPGEKPSVNLYLYDSINDEDKDSGMTIPINTPTRKQIIIGQIELTKKSFNLIQGHTGVAYFDFTSADAYNGTFTISFSDDLIKVSGGSVRVINKRVDVDECSFDKDDGIIYIKVSSVEEPEESEEPPEDGSEPPLVTKIYTVIEMDSRSSLPEDTDTELYYLIGTIKDGKIIQEHHGGIPLFLFFSSDCINTSASNEGEDEGGDTGTL